MSGTDITTGGGADEAGYDVQLFSPDSPRMEEFARFASELYAGDPFWTPPAAPADLPEAACFLVSRGGRALGRACGGANPGIMQMGEPTALVGWYECADDPAAARVLLATLGDHYRDRGYRHLIGPMNGSTWHRYRIADPSPDAPFFLDVHNKPWYAEQWRVAGFEPVGRYFSSKRPCAPGGECGDSGEERIVELVARYRDRGVVIRSFDLDDFDGELKRMHEVSLAGFTRSPFYTPIGLDAFRAIYTPIRPLIDPDLVLIAELEGEPLSFIFAVDNLHVPERGRSLVVKSVVNLPHRSAPGLGTLLTELVHSRAAERGYAEVIHALMHEANRSLGILADGSTVHRSYTLFGRSL
jgi:hypothetical protein